MKFRLISVLILLLTFYGCAQNGYRQKHPNIIYILADDLGYGELGIARRIRTDPS